MAETPQAVPHPTRTARPARAVHNVKPGETLDSIAANYGYTANQLKKKNAHTVGSNGAVNPGMRLEV